MSNMKTYLHAVTLRFPDGNGGLSDQAMGTQFGALECISDDELLRLKALARSYGGDVEIDAVDSDLIAGSPHVEIGQWAEAELKRALGIIDGASPDLTDARMNELERSIRNQGRQMLKLTESIADITQAVQSVAAMLQKPQGVILSQARPDLAQITPNPAATVSNAAPAFTPNPAAQTLTAEQSASASMGFPLVGSPPPMLGDATMPMNPSARGRGQTLEMASGQMQVVGPPPTSNVFSYSGKKNENGDPIFTKHELPKVGDTLQGIASKSDIAVPQ